MTFTPPEIKPSQEEWNYATYIARRRQPFKIHRTEKNARAALNLRDPWAYKKTRGGILYKIIDGRWQEIERVG